MLVFHEKQIFAQLIKKFLVVYKTWEQEPIMNQMNEVYILIFYFIKI
jgi:hypothetical protein